MDESGRDGAAAAGLRHPAHRPRRYAGPHGYRCAARVCGARHPGRRVFEHAEKTYETELLLGVATDTEDTTGTVLTRREVSVTQEQLDGTLERFRGEIMQIPPMYSALKVNGQKLCDLARKGRQVERQPRPVTIHELTLLSREGDTLRLRVRCSKGTYIRTLCADIGEALGCGGCMQALRRTQAGEYTIAEAVPLQQLLESPEPETYLRDVDTMFRGYPGVKLTVNQESGAGTATPFPSVFPAEPTALTASRENFSCWRRWKMALCQP